MQGTSQLVENGKAEYFFEKIFSSFSVQLPNSSSYCCIEAPVISDTTFTAHCFNDKTDLHALV